MAEPILVPTFGLPVTPDGQANIEFHTWMDQITNAANNRPATRATATATYLLLDFFGKTRTSSVLLEIPSISTGLASAVCVSMGLRADKSTYLVEGSPYSI